MFSNTATPWYYGDFREKVINGEIPVNKEIVDEMNRIDDLISNPGIWYDDSKVEGYIRFCNEELTLTDGSDMHLLDTFKLWAEQLFGWWYYVERSVYVPNADGHGGKYVTKQVKKRLINKQYIITSRGSAKSIYASSIHAYGLNVDTETTSQIATAPTMKQAEETLSPIKTAIARARGPLFKFLTDGSLQNTAASRKDRIKLTPSKKGIENFLTNSLLEIRPMSVDKLQGARPKYSSVDEWLSGECREDVIGAIEQGASKLDDYIILATSSEGTVRNGVGDTIKMELLDILHGKYINPHVSIFYYRLDSIEEVNDPSMWMKASPNIGKTVSYETYQWMSRELRSPHQQETIFLQRDLAYLLRVIHISLHTKRLFHTENKIIGRCLALWVQTCLVAMTSVHLHFYSHSVMINMA